MDNSLPSCPSGTSPPIYLSHSRPSSLERTETSALPCFTLLLPLLNFAGHSQYSDNSWTPLLYVSDWTYLTWLFPAPQIVIFLITHIRFHDLILQSLPFYSETSLLLSRSMGLTCRNANSRSHPMLWLTCACTAEYTWRNAHNRQQLASGTLSLQPLPSVEP